MTETSERKTVEQPGSEAPDAPRQVTGPDHLRELTDAHDVVLVDFYADWCGPCKILEPVVAELAAETSAAVAKVDVEANRSLAAEFGVRSVPTLVLFAGGSPAERLVGVREKHHYARLVAEYAE